MAKTDGAAEAGSVSSGLGGARVIPPGILRTDKRGTPFYDVVGSKGELLIRVGHYHDPVVNDPKGMARFLDYLPVHVKEVEQGKWASLALDSVSSTSLNARKYHQYDLNEDARDPRQWYGGGADITEEVVCLQLPSMPHNVGVAFHVFRVAGGERQPFVPGKRMIQSKSVPAQYPELWRLYAERDEEGKKIRRIQTDHDGKYLAGTCIGLEDDVKVTRKGVTEIWTKVVELSGGSPIHLALYGDPHVGKSTLLAGMPKPLYVALFDGVGKDHAYRIVGKVKEDKK